MAVSRAPRMLTLAHGEMETLRILPPSYAEVDALARDWVQPPPGAAFALRIPVEFLPWQAARMVQSQYVWLTSEETYQLATSGNNPMRIEIVSEAPPPEVPALPPPPPVLEMPATFRLELSPGQTVAIDTTITSDDLDMSKTEDGTIVDGSFWGKVDIVHDGDLHKMDFSGTRVADPALTDAFFFDARTLSKLLVALRPPVARCTLSILAPQQQYCDVTLQLAPMWKLGVTWPSAEYLEPNKVKFFLRVHPSGAMEHFESNIVLTSLYYEALPDLSLLDPTAYIAPYNSFAMPSRDFVPHLGKVLEELNVSLRDRTNFVNNNLFHFNNYPNIAYRFMSPNRLRSAIDVQVSGEAPAFMRVFLLYRGISDDEMPTFASAGEKEATSQNWKDVVGWTERMKDGKEFRMLELSVLEVH